MFFEKGEWNLDVRADEYKSIGASFSIHAGRRNSDHIIWHIQFLQHFEKFELPDEAMRIAAALPGTS